MQTLTCGMHTHMLTTHFLTHSEIRLLAGFLTAINWLAAFRKHLG